MPDADWLPVEDAVRAALSIARPLPVEHVPLSDALGRALAATVASRVDHPPWNNSAMDGFAVRQEDVRGASSDSPVVLPVRDEIPAGGFPRGPLAPGTAARVMTGAPVPEGATGVIRIEHTDGGPAGRVTILRPDDAGRNLRLKGEDLRRERTKIEAGTTLTPAAIGVLAAMGWPRVPVRRAPRVALLSNGDELADFDGIDDVIAGRRILNSNAHALAAQVREAGGIAVPLGIARDDPADVRGRLEEADGCDVLVTTAGVSVGDHDHVKRALDELGMRRLFWRVRLRPGSPTTAGLLGDVPVFGLPGNPVSAMVTFEIFVRPVLRRMAGHARLERPLRTAIAGEPLESPAGLTHCFRVRLEERDDGLPVARLTGPQGSGVLTSMLDADALAIVPEGTERVEAGSEIRVRVLR